MIDFEGQVAVVTGAGRGMGRLYALELAARGAVVVVNDLGGTMGGDGSDAKVADAVVEEIRAAGGTALASYDTVDTPEGGAAIVDAALDGFGRLDAVVSNAGILHTAAFEDLTDARAFVGLADGWVADTPSPTADDIATHLEQIAAPEPYLIPGSIFDEVIQVCQQVGIGG